MNNRNKTLIIAGVIWAVLAIGFVILGFAISGEDILGWFSSKYAILTYTFLAVYLIVFIIFIVLPAIRDRL